MRVGVISDTHGLLRESALEALAGVDHILHAGDVGDAGILARLGELAPVTAVRGNVDTHGACALLPEVEAIELAGRLVYMLHALADLSVKPVSAGIALVVSGHTHRASVEWCEGVLYLNPGSAGPRRFSLPISLALVELGDEVTARVVELAP